MSSPTLWRIVWADVAGRPACTHNTVLDRAHTKSGRKHTGAVCSPSSFVSRSSVLSARREKSGLNRLTYGKIALQPHHHRCRVQQFLHGLFSEHYSQGFGLSIVFFNIVWWQRLKFIGAYFGIKEFKKFYAVKNWLIVAIKLTLSLNSWRKKKSIF